MSELRPSREGDCTFDRPLPLDSGADLAPVNVHYAIYGEPTLRRDNVILVCHALSGSARVAEWWPELFGGVFDLTRDCVMCTNIIGSCYGSTGPTSINSRTQEPYGAEFPLVSIRDMVRAQAVVLDHLGIQRVRATIGGSIGGMQALQWAVDFPDRVGHAIAIGAAPLSAMGLALNHLQRQAIQLDPAWRGGKYPADDPPKRGLALARAVAMCSYKSAELFAGRFGRRPNRNGEQPEQSLDHRYDVAGYLDHQGEKFYRRFDANSYLVISKAMDTFDLSRGYGSEEKAFQRITASVSLVGISSDWLFPAADVRALGDRLRATGVQCDYSELQSSHGHDGFLADPHLLAPVLKQHFRRPQKVGFDVQARAAV